MSTEFQGKRVLVTGGAGGVGSAIVKKFVEAGAIVFALDYSEDALKTLVSEFPTVVPVIVDLLDWNASKKAVEAILPLHHLVNNAGIFIGSNFLEITPEIIDRTFGVNFKAAFNLTQVFAKGVIEHKLEGGTIVNISSIGDTLTVRGVSTYSCSKAAIAMLTRTSATELGQYNIRVNAVRPAGMHTQLYRDLVNYPEIAQAAAAITDRAPLKKQLETSDVANLVYFLSSSQSSMMTGDAVAVDGGLGVA